MSRTRVIPAIAIFALFLAACAHNGASHPAPRTAPSGAAEAKGIEALLLSCMDYRLVDDTERYMSARGLREQYDHVVLAGAALGAVTEQKPAWNETFREHLDVAVQLHSIRRVIVMDHRDCGAFRVFLGEDVARDRRLETEAHANALRALASRIREQAPGLGVELLLMDLDGSVETIPEAP